MPKYAAHDAFTIYGVGETRRAALAEGRKWVDDPNTRLKTARVSDELALDIDILGWDGDRQSFKIVNGEIFETTKET